MPAINKAVPQYRVAVPLFQPFMRARMRHEYGKNTKKKKPPWRRLVREEIGAGDEIRTHDFNLGKTAGAGQNLGRLPEMGRLCGQKESHGVRNPHQKPHHPERLLTRRARLLSARWQTAEPWSK
jgi:hypothetical protein